MSANWASSQATSAPWSSSSMRIATDRYRYLTTWLGEHQNESDMAFYSTQPFEHMVGPGIGRAEYGGLLMTLPPRRLYDVWSDPDYDMAETKARAAADGGAGLLDGAPCGVHRREAAAQRVPADGRARESEDRLHSARAAIAGQTEEDSRRARARQLRSARGSERVHLVTRAVKLLIGTDLRNLKACDKITRAFWISGSIFCPDQPINSMKGDQCRCTLADLRSENAVRHATGGTLSLRSGAARLLHWTARTALPCLILLHAASECARASLDPDKPITQYIHQGWTTVQGLPQNSVLSMAQTADGYLWFGTEEGLVRFDGVRFAIFDKRTAGIRNNKIQALLVDHEQTLWIGTNGGGLSCLRQGRFTVYTIRDGLSSDTILSLYEDKAGALWIGTDGGGLIRFQNRTFHVFTKAAGLADNVVFSISGDTHGSLWIGTHGGLSLLAEGRFVAPKLADGLATNYIHSTYVDRQGIVWVGTNSDGLYRVGPGGATHFTTRDGLTSNAIYSLYQDAAGTLWIGTGAGGVDRLANGKFSSFTAKDGLLGKDVWAILEDREGSLWIGTAGGGLNGFKKGSFTTLSKNDGLITDTILPVYEDREGALWMGSDQGLMHWQDGRVTAYTTKQGLPDNLVFSITQDREGSFWIGTRGGLARLTHGKLTAFSAKSGLPNDYVVCTYTDRRGDIWIGTRGGLTHFDGRRFITYTTRDGLSNNYVHAIYEDQNAVLWIGTSGGLDRFAKGQFTAYTTRDGLSSGVVLSIYGEPDGTLWLATDGGGIDRFRRGKFTSYTGYDGLYDDAVFQILDDAHARDAKWPSSLVSRGPDHSRAERRRERGNRVVRHHPSTPHSLRETRQHSREALGRWLVALTEAGALTASRFLYRVCLKPPHAKRQRTIDYDDTTPHATSISGLPKVLELVRSSLRHPELEW